MWLLRLTLLTQENPREFNADMSGYAKVKPPPFYGQPRGEMGNQPFGFFVDTRLSFSRCPDIIWL